MQNPALGLARLKALELQGYKTFASKNTFLFSPTITAIVGPNGSGKSNITDAIRWVLGEQSFSLLRGKRTEDMIFSGSDARSRASMAAATITFDNSDGWLPIEFTEVTVGRRAYRDGQNEYMLNGQRVRLRDVTELLAKTGLAQRTYTIIGQGLVDAALSLRADERRQLFEEAAGIGLYRSRREEALRRLDTTQRNLERIQDILAELRPRLRSLKRQVERSQGYEQVRSDLLESLRIWYGYHWYRLLDTLREQDQQSKASTKERDALRVSQAEAESEVRGLRSQMDALREQLAQARGQIDEQSRERERLRREVAVAEERLRWLSEDDLRLRAEIEDLQVSLGEISQQAGTALDQVKEAQEQLDELMNSRQALLEAGHVGSDQREQLRTELMQARSELEALAGEEGALRARREGLQRQIEAHGARTAPLQEESSKLAAERDQAAGAHEQAAAKVTELEGQAAVQEAELTRLAAEAKEARERALELQGELSLALQEAATLEGRLNGLHPNLGDSSRDRRLVRAHETGRIAGMLGRLAESIQIEPGYETAILAALGSAWQGLAFEDIEQALAAARLDDIEGGSGSVVLLVPGPGTGNGSPVEAPAGSLGYASAFVRAAGDVETLVHTLLAKVLVVPDRDQARSLLPGLSGDSAIVTLDGDLFEKRGTIVIGAGQAERELGRGREALEKALADAGAKLARLQGEHDRLQRQANEADATGMRVGAAHDRLQAELKSAREALEQNARELAALDSRSGGLAARLKELQEEGEQLATALRLLEAEDQDLEGSRARLESAYRSSMSGLELAESSTEMQVLEGRLERAQNVFEAARAQFDAFHERQGFVEREIGTRQARLDRQEVETRELQKSIRESGKALETVEAQIAALQSEMSPAESALVEAQARRRELEAGDSELRAALQSSEREVAQVQIELARRQEEMASMRRRIEDDFGLVAFEEDDLATSQEPLPLEGIVERLPRVEALPPDIENQLKQQRMQLRRIGSVNPEARREYREVKERTEFLTAQVDDLRAAEKQIHEVIAELDVLMEREFRVTFEAVAAAFKETFTRLFGGGSARLTLTDPDDLTQTGIDIEARLPGRRTQSLAMLSGGERSLTASALVFALLKVSPTPFCVLDEVDAMLDEANVVRYSEMLRELSADTQFILITHNRQTVQAAQVVYGVSMGPDTASKVISLKLDEVEHELTS
jgi:chromosome segregation protein